MSELTTKLHIKQNDVIYEVTVYDNAEEATPEGGSYLHVFNPNNNETGYIGLWPQSETSGGNHSPLSVTKNNTLYWLECIVNNAAIDSEVTNYTEDDNTEIIFVYEDTTLEDLTNISFTNSNKYKTLYMDKKLNISTSILNAANIIIIPADEDLYNSFKEDTYWTNYLEKISFIQSYNTGNKIIGKDISTDSYSTIGDNLIIDNDKCIVNEYMSIAVTGENETIGQTTYKTYAIPNSSETVYDIYEES